MLFNLALILSLAVFAGGVIWRVGRWFTTDPASTDSRGRASAALRGSLAAVSGPRILALLKTLALDVFLQVKTLRQSPFRWAMHLLIWLGFVLLVLFHAMDGVVSERLFGDYFATVNPYFAGRDILGLMVLAGVLMAASRRLWAKQPRLRSGGRDWAALAILGVIIVSGFLLAGMKITSKQAFDRMVAEYALLDEGEAVGLESYWKQEFGRAASPLERPLNPEAVEAGRETHEFYCAGCHASPQTAPASYLTSRAIAPAAGLLDRAGFATFLWYLHFLAAFAGLAYLPFGKFFHIIATPVHLLAQAGRSREPDPANAATMRALALDACMHCGSCSEICAVGAAHAVIPNDIILPSEKIGLLRRLSKGIPLNGDRRAVVQGMVLCTNCNRCGDACPAGIDLQPMWAAVREKLLGSREIDPADPISLSPLSFYRAGKAGELGDAYAEPLDRAWQALARLSPPEATLDLSRRDERMRDRVKSSAQGFSFSSCYSCKACSSACPVKDQFANPQAELGLLPHQIIHATLLGQSGLVAGARMLWACLGCYQCQEQCPQGVAVTDVLYELKNMTMSRASGKESE